MWQHQHVSPKNAQLGQYVQGGPLGHFTVEQWIVRNIPPSGKREGCDMPYLWTRGPPWALRGTIHLRSPAEDTEGCTLLGTHAAPVLHTQPRLRAAIWSGWRKTWGAIEASSCPVCPSQRPSQRAHGCWFGTASVAEELLTRLTGNAHFCSFLCCFEALA